MWGLPVSINIDGTEHKIRNKCDFRVVLDVISALNDKELDEETRIKCALFIFYEDVDEITDYQIAIDEMMKIINIGEESSQNEHPSPKIMDWEYDYKNIIPPINRVLGYSVRDSSKYTHWWDFIGAYMEIGDCYFAQIISIRQKRAKGIKLDKSDERFYREHKKEICLPISLSDDEKEWLDSDW